MIPSKASLGLIAGLIAVTPLPALAQQNTNCAARAKVVDRLADAFGETRQSIGLGANNAVVEVFASDETGTWTITVTLPSGQTCLIASGKAFESIQENLAELQEKDA